MRWTWLFGALALAGCDSTYRQVGSGNDPGATTPYDTALGDDDDDDNEGGRAYCDRREAQGICEEYIGDGWDPASIDASCSGAEDELKNGSCPPSDLGGCDETRENPEGTLVWYYTGDFFTSSDAGALETTCLTNYDTWIAP